MAESEEELRSLLMKVKEESAKAGLKLNIQKTKIMASSPITSWQIDGETMETVTDFYFLGLQSHCRWWPQPWNKRRLLLGKKAMTNLDSILKTRDITLLTKVCIAMVLCMDVRPGPQRRLGPKEWMLSSCVAGEDSWESLGLQGDPTSPS